MQICENAMVHSVTGISVHCVREATIIKNPGTIYEIRLCDDCDNDEKLLEERLMEKVAKQTRAAEQRVKLTNGSGESPVKFEFSEPEELPANGRWITHPK